MQTAIYKAKHIKLLLLDVDGVLTDGSIYFTDSGQEFKAFNSRDGIGIKLLIQNRVNVGIITGRRSSIVERRMRELGVTLIYQAQSDKLQTYEAIKNQLQLNDEQIAYMGDDLPDLACIRRAGLGISVPNGCAITRQHADWLTSTAGGKGAVREACEFIMDAQNTLQALCESLM